MELSGDKIVLGVRGGKDGCKKSLLSGLLGGYAEMACQKIVAVLGEVGVTIWNLELTGTKTVLGVIGGKCW